ncbi:MAG: hypothetical protein WCB67_09065, partial [Solirubrobacteraceae bacterium]
MEIDFSVWLISTARRNFAATLGLLALVAGFSTAPAATAEARTATTVAIASSLATTGTTDTSSTASTANTASPAIDWNFEDGTLQGWTVQPNSNFGPLITERVYYHNNPATPWNKEGKYFLSTEENPNGNPNDAYTGVINSPTFTLTRPMVTMLVGGGSSPQTYVAACLADPTQPYGCQVVAKAQGADEEPFLYRTMDLSAYVGKSLFLQVVDESQGGWGHVTLDDVRVNYPSV